jgi:tetratricopeptide (TPR) repeat protein
LGVSYDQLHKSKEAIAAYRSAVDLDPDNMDAERGLATALLTDGQLDEALKVLNLIVAVEPQDALSQIHISEVQRRQGHYDLALQTLEKAKPLAPDSLELTFNEALLYDSLGRYDDAVSVLQKLISTTAKSDGKYSDPEKANRALFLDRLANVYRYQNKTSEAIAIYKQIIALGGDYVKSGYQNELEAYRDAHMWKEASATASEAAKAAPNDRTIQLMYASQLADTGQFEKGISIAKAQLAKAADSQDNREVYISLAQMYIRNKDFKAAAEQLDKAEALSTKPDDKLYVTFVRGSLYDRQKMYDQAETEFRKCLAIDPNNATILNYLGYMLADRGVKLSEALTMIQKAVELDPQNGAYLDSLGWVYYKSGQYALAEENLRKANERINTDPTVHDHLGEVYEKTGKLKEAVSQWERSLTQYASSLPADADPEDVSKVQHKLDNARIKLAKVNTEKTK